VCVSYSRPEGVVTDLFHDCCKRVGLRITVQFVAVGIDFLCRVSADAQGRLVIPKIIHILLRKDMKLCLL